ncbi:pilus assembly protein [Agromyces indicus]|uniref:Pilus assembly protein n=1 Tax=Agromyces indicus TaxID=758919 RepID=A0ABU1FH19_9MICO|nr:pilus assembly protein [Agromyces indicus]MDR5691038.1 pilus assembly protein [Agromyces indicus]
MTAREDDRGAIAVWVALAIVPLLMFLALVADYGLAAWERGQLQNGADAAALAVAQNCGSDPAGCFGEASGIATTMAGGNANDTQANAAISDFVIDGNSGQVRVTATTLNGASTTIRLPFASLFRPSDATMTATAKAEWGVPVYGSTIPLAMAECELTNRLASLDATTPQRILIRNDTNASCPGGGPGGFGWLADDNCLVEVGDDSVVLGTVGNNENGTGCPADFAVGLLGKTILVPLYDSSVGTGNSASDPVRYTISRFAAFYITGVKPRGGSSAVYLGGSPLTPVFTGNSRGLQGYFVRYVELGEEFELGNGNSTGLMVVRMTE